MELFLSISISSLMCQIILPDRPTLWNLDMIRLTSIPRKKMAQLLLHSALKVLNLEKLNGPLEVDRDQIQGGCYTLRYVL